MVNSVFQEHFSSSKMLTRECHVPKTIFISVSWFCVVVLGKVAGNWLKLIVKGEVSPNNNVD